LENEPTYTTRPARSRVWSGFDGAAAEAELAVVVVLQDGRLVALGPGEQGQASRQRHRHAQRELVRGGDVDQPGAGRDDVNDHPLVVDRDAGHPGAEGPQQPPRRAVAGVLDGHLVAGGEQHPGDEVDRLLGSVGDHDVVGGGLHPTGEADVAGDRLTEPGMAGRVGVVAGADRGGGELPGQQLPPTPVGEQPGVGDPGAEVELGRPLDHPHWEQVFPDRPGPQGLAGRSGPVARAGEVVGDEGAGADPAGDEPLAEEPVVGDHDGGARDAQLRGQLAGGWQATAGGQAAVQDGPAQLPVDLAGQVLAADQADMELHGGQGSGGPIGLVNRARNWISQRSPSAPRLAKVPHAH
jgi:hypothetical protein